MKPENKATALSAFALGLIALCFLTLLHEVVISQKMWAEIPRIIAGLLAPVPIAIFFGFSFVHLGNGTAIEPSPGRMSLLLLFSILFTVGIGWLLQSPDTGVEASTGAGPAIAESSVFTASVLNFFFLRSQIVAALLSGVSIGLTVFVIFLT